jgi:hypothetical protein
MNDEPTITNLIQGIRVTNPSLYQAILMLSNNVFRLDEQLNPLVIQSKEREKIESGVGAPTTFTYELPGTSLRLKWAEVDGARQYEIRLGDNWDTADFQIRTSSLRADLDPVISGRYHYLIKTLNNSGTYSTDMLDQTIDIPTVGGVSITARVIDNNVLLNWTTPSSPFDIDYYEIQKGGVVIGKQRGTFIAIFEATSGNYNYGIIGIDLAGNRGLDTTLAVDVKQPPDFQFQASITSQFPGTKVNCFVSNLHLIAPLTLTETWSTHFSTRSWNTIQDQVNAGYSFYCQPTYFGPVANSYYEEIFDYGAVFNSIIASVTYNFDPLFPSDDVTINIKMATSTDNITYTSFAVGSVQYFPTLRYIKLRIEIGAHSDKGLIDISNLNIRIDVKREVDSGLVNALAGDATGTLVYFNKAFRDIDSITLTANAIQPIVAIYDFVDVPNPVSFKVYAFNSAGARVNYPVSWKARGIV